MKDDNFWTTIKGWWSDIHPKNGKTCVMICNPPSGYQTPSGLEGPGINAYVLFLSVKITYMNLKKHLPKNYVYILYIIKIYRVQDPTRPPQFFSQRRLVTRQRNVRNRQPLRSHQWGPCTQQLRTEGGDTPPTWRDHPE